MSNLQFEVGQLFMDVVEFCKAVRNYDAVNGYNVKFKAIDAKEFWAFAKMDANGGFGHCIWVTKTGSKCNHTVWTTRAVDTNTTGIVINISWCNVILTN